MRISSPVMRSCNARRKAFSVSSFLDILYLVDVNLNVNKTRPRDCRPAALAVSLSSVPLLRIIPEPPLCSLQLNRYLHYPSIFIDIAGLRLFVSTVTAYCSCVLQGCPCLY